MADTQKLCFGYWLTMMMTMIKLSGVSFRPQATEDRLVFRRLVGHFLGVSSLEVEGGK